MKEDRGGILAILVVLLGGLFVTLPGGGGDSAQSSKTIRVGEAARQYDSCAGNLDAVVRAFLAGVPVKTAAPPPADATGTPSPDADGTRALDALHRVKQLAWDSMYPVELVIATVPDPIDSTVGWTFDERVAAIKQAAEDTGHAFDRFWLPWKCQDKSAGVHRDVPGVLIFRGSYHSLVVLLVGETPSSGVQKAALAASLRFAEGWRKAKVSCAAWNDRNDTFRLLAPTAAATYFVWELGARGLQPAERYPCPQLGEMVYIVGPTFSGSITSIRQVLQAWRADRGDAPKVRIVSGSATNSVLRDLLARGTDPNFSKDVTLKTTILPDAFLVTALNIYLKNERKVDPSQVAILVESGTGYGQMFKAELKSRGSTEGGWRILPFPLHISQIREASKKQRENDELSEELLGDQKPILAVELGETGEALDVLPAMVPGVSGASEELALANILSTIAREGFTYVGLLATDTRDKLFLAERIRKYAPDVTLFTFESNLLYGHPDHNRDLEGMLVVSTYPLFTPNQRWTQSKDRAAVSREMVQFSSDGAQGTYNATLAQLNRMREELTHLEPEREGESSTRTRPRSVTPLLEYSMPHEPESSYPAVFVSAVGRRGAWPIHAYSFEEIVCERKKPECQGAGAMVETCDTIPDSSCDAARTTLAGCGKLAKFNDCRKSKLGESAFPRETLLGYGLLEGPFGTDAEEFEEEREEEGPRNLGSAWIAFQGLLALAVVLMLLARPLYSRAWSPFESRLCGVCRRRQRRLLWGMFVTLSMTLILFFRPYANFLGWWLVLFAPLLALTVGFPAVIAWLVWTDDDGIDGGGACGHRKSAKWRLGLGKWSLLIAQGIILTAAGVIAVELQAFPKEQRYFLLYRAGNLGSGLSSLAPLVFLSSGFLWWFFLNIRRLELVESSLPEVPVSPNVSGPLFRLLSSVKRSMQTALSSARWPYVTTGLVLLLLPMAFVVYWLQPIFEGIVLGYGLLILIIVFYNVILALSLLHLVFLWRRVRRLPSFFAARWPRRAFGRIAGRLPADTLRGLWARQIRVSDLDAFVQLARDAAKALPESSGCKAREAAKRSPDYVAEIKTQARVAAQQVHKSIEKATETNLWRHFAGTDAQRALTRAAIAASQLLDELEIHDPNGEDAEAIKWIAALEDLAASQYIVFLAPSFLYMRSLATFIVGASLLFLLAVTSYPVQPAGVLLLQGFIWLLGSTSAALFVSLQARNDPVLRQLEPSSEGALGFFDSRLVTTLGTYVVLPAAGLLATTSPEFAGLVEQVLRIFR